MSTAETKRVSEPARTMPEDSSPLASSGDLHFRHDERYEVQGEAEVIVKSGALGTTILRGSILDISTSGCYIQTVARFPIKPEQEVEILFTIYGIPFQVMAACRFAKSRVGIGFRFLKIDEANRYKLYSALADLRSQLIEGAPDDPLAAVEKALRKSQS